MYWPLVAPRGLFIRSTTCENRIATTHFDSLAVNLMCPLDTLLSRPFNISIPPFPSANNVEHKGGGVPTLVRTTKHALYRAAYFKCTAVNGGPWFIPYVSLCRVNSVVAECLHAHSHDTTVQYISQYAKDHERRRPDKVVLVVLREEVGSEEQLPTKHGAVCGSGEARAR